MTRRTRKTRGVRQLTIFPRGGRRHGAGRKPRGPQPTVSHKTRPAFVSDVPILVTTHLRSGLPSLRTHAVRDVLREAFAAAVERHALRVVHFSAQSNHLHFVVEAACRQSLSRGMQGLLVRIARALNRLWGRRGSVFADRYDARILKSPREVRAALVYVLQNARKHGGFVAGADPFSSAPWFDGWEHPPGNASAAPRATSAAKTWLLRVGWKRHGMIEPNEVPARGAA